MSDFFDEVMIVSGKKVSGVIYAQYYDGRERLTAMKEFRFDPDIVTCESDFRARICRAVERFLKMEEGIALLEEYRGHFNWGDALQDIPAKFFIAEGLAPVDPGNFKYEISVDMDNSVDPGR